MMRFRDKRSSVSPSSTIIAFLEDSVNINIAINRGVSAAWCMNKIRKTNKTRIGLKFLPDVLY